ncbi:MAG: polysaccharide lyase family 7 protein, partial [Pseudomonadota bacterium]
VSPSREASTKKRLLRVSPLYHAMSSESQGGPRILLLDLGAEQTLTSLDIAWYKGDTRKSRFFVEASLDGETYETIISERESAGSSLELEPNEIQNATAKYLRISGLGNESNNWNSITEISAMGCGEEVAAPAQPVLTERRGEGMFGLDPNVPPGSNFDLTGWYITTPADDDGDGKADSVYENELAAGWEDPRYFYTDPVTGGLVFRSTPAGARTSANTNYTRTELRGMLRSGDYSIETRIAGGYPNLNNWVFSSAPESAQAAAAGVDGVLRATLSVNQVTRQGRDHQVGRVIIGQIHAKDDEPIRLYYRKLPQNKFGSIYYAHEPATGREEWVELIGSRADWTPNPDDGIALDEVFSYEIEVIGTPEGDEIIPMLHVKIIRDDGTEVIAEPYDMRDSGFSVEDEFMFFKAGAYSQNNSSPEPETDFDRVTFFALNYEHGAPPAGDGVVPVAAPVAAAPVAAAPGVIFDDSFADGVRDGGDDPTGGNWWTTTTSAAIEIAPNALGLVSGGSGRGIRTTFDPQMLAPGQAVQATFSFTTPETIGTDRDSAFRIGLYDTLGRAELEGDLSASSSNPQPLYDGLPGYMIDFDIGLTDAAASNIDIRRHNEDTQGRLLGTTKGYQRLAGGGEPYTFEANQDYTGSITLRRLEDGVEISGTLSQDGALLTSFSHVDGEGIQDTVGMLAFHVNSKTFGTSKDINTPDNGLDFSNIRVEVLAAN